MSKKFKKPLHTPGPWTVGMTGEYGTLNPNIIYVNDSSESVCQVYEVPLHTSLEEIEHSGTWDVGLANARLIAASPDLLDVLKECVNGLDCQPGYVRSQTLIRAQSVLAKVEGR